MAANVTGKLFAKLNYARNVAIRYGKTSSCGCRSISSSSGNKPPATKSKNEVSQDDREPKVGMSADGSVLICWHPEPKHPYEHTQPICYTSPEAKAGEGKTNKSPLKDWLVEKYLTRDRPDGPNIFELSNITYTTKHRWYPQTQKKFRKKDPPTDRDGI